MKNLKVIFMGTPLFAVPVLEKLIEECNVILVVSQPDREKNRKGVLLPTPVKEIALKNNIPVFQPFKIRSESEKITSLNADVIITCAYGQIIPEVILNSPKYGAINVHASLLPRYRGGAPIHHAIINGDKKTGITIMYMDKGMDTGDIISKEEIEILDSDNLDSVCDKLSKIGSSLLIKTLPSIISHTNDRIKQDESEVTYAYNISKEEEKISFNDTSLNIFNKIRGLSSVPGAYGIINGKRMKIYSSFITSDKTNGDVGEIINIDKTGIYVNTKDKVICITELMLEGKKRCNAHDFVNGIKKEEYIHKIFE